MALQVPCFVEIEPAIIEEGIVTGSRGSEGAPGLKLEHEIEEADEVHPITIRPSAGSAFKKAPAFSVSKPALSVEAYQAPQQIEPLVNSHDPTRYRSRLRSFAPSLCLTHHTLAP